MSLDAAVQVVFSRNLYFLRHFFLGFGNFLPTLRMYPLLENLHEVEKTVVAITALDATAVDAAEKTRYEQLDDARENANAATAQRRSRHHDVGGKSSSRRLDGTEQCQRVYGE